MKKSDTAVKKPPKTKFTNRQIGIEVLLLLVTVAAVYLLLSLISFDPADPSWSQTAWHEPIRNWGGVVGAYLSDILLQFFGFVAYSVPILMVVLCVQAMIHYYYHNDKPVNYFSLSLRVIGILAFLFSATGFFALNIQDLEQFQAGGILGDIVADEVLPFFNHIGASVLLFAICIACITLLTGLSWLFIAEMVGACVVMIATPILTLIVSLFKRSTHKIKPRQNDEQNRQLDIELAEVEDLAPIESSAPQIKASQDTPELQDDNQQDSHEVQQHQVTTTDLSHHENVLIQAEQPDPVAEVAHQVSTQLMAEEEEPIYASHQHEQQSVIDENNPPPKLVEHEAVVQHHDFTINPDYYSPLSLAKEEHVPVVDEQTIAMVEIEEDDVIAPVGSYGAIDEQKPHSVTANIDEVVDDFEDELPVNKITKENIHDSLIHPLLQKENKLVQKPTTPLPSLSLLTAPPVKQVEVDHVALKATADLIEKSLADFRVKARVVDYLPGPVITRFEIELAPGVKASRISTLDRDLARSLSMPSVRVVEVIPGKPYVGIELPNLHRQTVYFREVLDSPQFKGAQSPLTVVLGKDIAGQSVVADLAKMPHLLVAGTTGSGKSVGVNAMILSILFKSQPEDVRFIMIDPKMLELSVYEGIPHLLTDVVTDMKDAANALNWSVNEMERRYRLMSALGVRNIAGYNEKIKLAEEMGRPIPDPLWRPGDSMDIDMPMLEKLPYIVVMVDEFADLIMAVGKKVEELIARLAQKARAAGIHLVLATQRPSVDVITGLIKANIPTRIAFTVSSKIDSRTILDQMGAESLLGMGDMLYLAPNSSIPVRVHGAFVRDEEVHSVVQDWKARGIPTQFIDNITSSSDEGDSDGFDNSDEELDPLFDQVVAFVVDKRRASISGVQRQFRIGYNRAARIVEQMESQGIVSAPSHNGNREVLAPPSGQDY